jgi:hypothetical protein
VPFWNDDYQVEHFCEQGWPFCFGCSLEAEANVSQLAEAMASGDDFKAFVMIKALGSRVEINRNRQALQIIDCGADLLVASFPLTTHQFALVSQALGYQLADN